MTFIQELRAILSKTDEAVIRPLKHFPYAGILLPRTNLSIWPLGLDSVTEAGQASALRDALISSRQTQPTILLGEDYWTYKRSVVLSRIEAHRGVSQRIHGRMCRVIELDQQRLDAFLTTHHLIGAVNARYRYGLTDPEGRVQAVAAFGRAVPIQRGDREYRSHELVRFCHHRGHHVNGGLSKLLQHFIRHQQPQDIYTAIDRDWSEGKGYALLGFEALADTSPAGFCLHGNGQRYRCVNNIRIWNSGNIKMVWKLI